ncbi:MAG TPA: response regulator transcription factor [Gaiellaceae bacterium]|nr:response regulator transcription factor [Gaiellaceae bacterium]
MVAAVRPERHRGGRGRPARLSRTRYNRLPGGNAAPPSAPVTCVLADDHPAMLGALARILEGEGFEVVGRADDGETALALIVELQPAIALLDLRMPRLSGIEIARRAAGDAPGTAIVLYTGHGETSELTDALAAGVRGFLLKEAPLADLARALRRIAGGETYVDPVLAGGLVGARLSPAQPELTTREREVLGLLARGLANDAVGEQLGISAETVRTHLAKAMTKLGAATRTEAVAIALRRSIIS